MSERARGLFAVVWCLVALANVACRGAPDRPSQVVAVPALIDSDGAGTRESPPRENHSEWSKLIEQELVWARSDLAPLCSAPGAAYFLARATGPQHEDARIAAGEHCRVLEPASILMAEPHGEERYNGMAVCCPHSTPRAPPPHTAGKPSCEQAIYEYLQHAVPKQNSRISAGQYGKMLNRGSYFAHCGVPDSTALMICAAVRTGQAIGVTVRTRPPNPEQAECVAASVFDLHFHDGDGLDVTRTVFQ